jgi:hypothetical protein
VNNIIDYAFLCRCVAHGINLFLKDIAKFGWIEDLLAEAHNVVKVITGNQKALALQREMATEVIGKLLELVKPGGLRRSPLRGVSYI